MMKYRVTRHIKYYTEIEITEIEFIEEVDHPTSKATFWQKFLLSIIASLAAAGIM